MNASMNLFWGCYYSYHFFFPQTGCLQSQTNNEASISLPKGRYFSANKRGAEKNACNTVGFFKLYLRDPYPYNSGDVSARNIFIYIALRNIFLK